MIEIQGGGRIEIQSDQEGLSIACSTLWIRSGGVLIADRLSVVADTVTIEQSGVIDLNYKVTLTHRSHVGDPWPRDVIIHDTLCKHHCSLFKIQCCVDLTSILK